MRRLYDELIRRHMEEDDDVMLFLSGPRQVGKTTSAQSMAAKLHISGEQVAQFLDDFGMFPVKVLRLL